jgi:hypothetical protein
MARPARAAPLDLRGPEPPRPLHGSRRPARRIRRGAPGGLPPAGPATPSRPQQRLARVGQALRGGPGRLRGDHPRAPAPPHAATLGTSAPAEHAGRRAAPGRSGARTAREGPRGPRPRPARGPRGGNGGQGQARLRRGARLRQDRRQPGQGRGRRPGRVRRLAPPPRQARRLGVVEGAPHGSPAQRPLRYVRAQLGFFAVNESR